jgi:hypothetical protein
VVGFVEAAFTFARFFLRLLRARALASFGSSRLSRLSGGSPKFSPSASISFCSALCWRITSRQSRPRPAQNSRHIIVPALICAMSACVSAVASSVGNPGQCHSRGVPSSVAPAGSKPGIISASSNHAANSVQGDRLAVLALDLQPLAVVDVVELGAS